MNKTSRLRFSTALAAACLALPVAPAMAVTFSIDYSGAEFLNAAEAHGFVTIDDALFASPSALTFLTPGTEVTAFSLTVTNASSGNGSFQLSDFAAFSWDTAGATLDPSLDLVGQMTTAGPWGSTHDGTTGDFNLLAADGSAAPSLVLAFQIATDGGAGDNLSLTSMRPVPLPAAAWLFGSWLAAFGAWIGKRRFLTNAAQRRG